MSHDDFSVTSKGQFAFLQEIVLNMAVYDNWRSAVL